MTFEESNVQWEKQAFTVQTGENFFLSTICEKIAVLGIGQDTRRNFTKKTHSFKTKKKGLRSVGGPLWEHSPSISGEGELSQMKKGGGRGK